MNYIEPMQVDVVLKWQNVESRIGHIEVPMGVTVGPADPETGELLTMCHPGGMDGMTEAVMDAFANLDIIVGEAA